MNDGKTAQWLAIAAVAAILGIGLGTLPTSPGATAPDTTSSIHGKFDIDWRWNRTVSGSMLAIHGTVRNNTTRRFKQVHLQLRIENQDGSVVARHLIVVRNLGPGEEKPFREDVPRTGREDMGFMEVVRVVR